jgi:hypothetical protein
MLPVNETMPSQVGVPVRSSISQFSVTSYMKAPVIRSTVPLARSTSGD